MEILAASVFTGLALLALARLTRGARCHDATLLMPHNLRDLLDGSDS